MFLPIVNSLLHDDHYRLLADFQPYVDCQANVGAVYADRDRWTRMSIANVARMGTFSSDRSIRDYCASIWHVDPVAINIMSKDQTNADLLQ